MINARLLLAWSHLLALGLGMGGVWARARALHDSLRNPEDPRALRRAFVGDSWWGIAALLWLVTGLWRLLAGTEKSTSYYLANHAFHLKITLFLAILGLEVWPMLTLIRWRRGRAAPNARDVGRIEVISYVECALVVAIVFAATSMARGYGGGIASITTSARPSASPRTDADRRQISPGEVAPRESGGDEIVTNGDLAVLTHEIGMPLRGIDPSTLHSSFDARRAGGLRKHQALDIMAPRFTPIFSAATGRVLKLFTSIAGGLMVYAADSSERFVLLYAHLDHYAAGLHDGQPLARGQLIGYVGSTGNASATAPHLHFAIARNANLAHWSKGTPLDPLPVLQASARMGANSY